MAAACLGAWGIPRLIPDGREGLAPAGLSAYDEMIRPAAWGLWDNPIERLCITRVVAAAVYAPTGEYRDGTWPPELRAVVLAYTFFGLPYSRIEAHATRFWVSWRLGTPAIGLAVVTGAVIGAMSLWQGPGTTGRRSARAGP